MPFQTIHLVRWNHISIGLGTIAWVLIVLASLFGVMVLDDLQIILLLAILIITPLAIPLVSLPRMAPLPSRLASFVLFLQPFAALLGGASFLLSMGPVAAALAVVWFLFTGLLALIGLLWLLQAPSRSLADLCLAVALLYLPIGGIWMVLARLGLQPLGFGVHTDLLTAVHFHFIALAALIITGLTGHAIQTTHHDTSWVIYHIAALGVLVNPILVATGLTIAQITNLHFLDTAPADLLALSLILIALLGLRFVVPATTSLFAKVLLVLSYTTVFVTMLFAGAYALGMATGGWTITLSQMILIHGLENALIFGLCGLFGWRIRVREEKRRGEVCA
ncbi:MAG TPA: YndJ family transporter [Ktedonobacteraceae bacterium]|nr:YndJ family transporter [Ktedonobacteraceae bacterium]